MTGCVLALWIMGGAVVGIPLCIGIGYLIKQLSIVTYKKVRETEFPKVNFNFNLPRIGIFHRIPQYAYSIILLIFMVTMFVKFIPWGHTKPCHGKIEQAFFQKMGQNPKAMITTTLDILK
jgi:hypothetical protein